MGVEVIIDIPVCTDCFMYAAIGNEALDTIDEMEQHKIVSSIEVLAERGYITTGMEQYGFTWEPCQCCKRKYGGDRFQLLVMVEVPSVKELTRRVSC